MGNDEPEIIDAEIVESDNLPAVIEASTRSSMDNDVAAVPRWSEEFWRRASPDVQARRCVGHKRNGDRCLKAAIKGATVCRTHGGATKHVQRAARVRLENAQDLMAQQLLGVALTAASEAVKLAAIKDVLDRGGLKAPSEVVLSQGETKPYEELFEDISTLSREESRERRGYEDFPAAQPLENPSYATAEHDPEAAPATVAEAYSPSAPPRQSGPREFDGDAHAQPRGERRSAPVRHITGDDAMRIANEINLAIGALPEQKAITSPHRRYLRP
jgi:hypothetical protein